MKQVYFPDNSSWHLALLNMVKRGDLTVEQYNLCCDRLRNTSNSRNKPFVEHFIKKQYKDTLMLDIQLNLQGGKNKWDKQN